jgi:hypothetical protein
VSDTHLFEVDIFCKFHVLRMDAEDLKTAGGIRNTNVDFTIETTETSEGGVDRVGPVSGGHNDNIGARFETVHEGEQLRNNTAFDFSICLRE